MPLRKRKCLRQDEDLTQHPNIKLDVFKNYNRKACLLECQARTLYFTCGCLPYYFPDFSAFVENKTACNVKGLKCLAEVASK